MDEKKDNQTASGGRPGVSPAQSATTAAKPLSGQAAGQGSTGVAGTAQSGTPSARPLSGQATGQGSTGGASTEHMRHQDKDVGQGVGSQSRFAGDQGRGAAQSASDTARSTAQSGNERMGQMAETAGDTVRRAAAQTQEQAGELYEKASDWARDSYDQASDWASQQYREGSRQWEDARRRGMQGAQDARRSIERFASENPVLIGVIGVAAGLLIGAILPRSRREDRAFGSWADEVRDQGMRYARDMGQRGRELVEKTFSDDDARYSQHGSDWRRDEQESGGRRFGPSGRYQNH